MQFKSHCLAFEKLVPAWIEIAVSDSHQCGPYRTLRDWNKKLGKAFSSFKVFWGDYLESLRGSLKIPYNSNSEAWNSAWNGFWMAKCQTVVMASGQVQNFSTNSVLRSRYLLNCTTDNFLKLQMPTTRALAMPSHFAGLFWSLLVLVQRWAVGNEQEFWIWQNWGRNPACMSTEQAFTPEAIDWILILERKISRVNVKFSCFE